MKHTQHQALHCIDKQIRLRSATEFLDLSWGLQSNTHSGQLGYIKKRGHSWFYHPQRFCRRCTKNACCCGKAALLKRGLSGSSQRQPKAGVCKHRRQTQASASTHMNSRPRQANPNTQARTHTCKWVSKDEYELQWQQETKDRDHASWAIRRHGGNA